VDLLENPERHTGYEGESPQRIWRAIYEENCFQESGQCLEKRVFYRLMSGLQSSITTHIASDYFHRSKSGGYGEGSWGHNTPLFVERVGRHPERLHNLYFTYVFVLRALSKAAPELETFDYSTGHPEEDARAAALMRALVRPDHPLVAAASAAATCQTGFDEKKLFLPAADDKDWSPSPPAAAAAAATAAFEDLLAGYSPPAAAVDAALEATALRSEFQARFRNISRIMDCVGCERCRLWGKLQVLGLGTALKVRRKQRQYIFGTSFSMELLLTMSFLIFCDCVVSVATIFEAFVELLYVLPLRVMQVLMSDDDLASEWASSARGYRLQRNEVIALLNVLAQLSKSVHSVHEWRQRELLLALLELSGRLLALVVLPWLTWLIVRRVKTPKKLDSKAN